MLQGEKDEREGGQSESERLTDIMSAKFTFWQLVKLCMPST